MMTYYFTVFACFAFAMGACIASFLNVCIWRIPRGENVAYPPSHCPNCNAPIHWYQNIPIISWCCLRGKCANCHKPISMRYTIVEAMGGVFFLLAYLEWGMPFFFGGQAPAFGLAACRSLWMVPANWVILAWLMLLAFIDLENSFFPTVLLYAGLVMGPILSFLVPELQGEVKRLPALYWSLGGEAVGFVSLWIVRKVGTVVVRRMKHDDTLEAMGDGDPYFLGAVGGFFGLFPVLFTIMMASFSGALIGLCLIVRGRAKLGAMTAVPFGPYLALGAVSWVFWGPVITNWYLHLFDAIPVK